MFSHWSQDTKAYLPTSSLVIPLQSFEQLGHLLYPVGYHRSPRVCLGCATKPEKSRANLCHRTKPPSLLTGIIRDQNSRELREFQFSKLSLLILVQWIRLRWDVAKIFTLLLCRWAGIALRFLSNNNECGLKLQTFYSEVIFVPIEKPARVQLEEIL